MRAFMGGLFGIGGLILVPIALGQGELGAGVLCGLGAVVLLITGTAVSQTTSNSGDPKEGEGLVAKENNREVALQPGSAGGMHGVLATHWLQAHEEHVSVPIFGVQAFIDSIPSLTYADWDAAKMFDVRNVPNLNEALDEASYEVVVALGDPALDRALTAAKAATIHAMESLGWSAGHPQVKQDAIYAAGAIVALSEVPFEKVVVRFLPFRNTRVVPVDWQS